MWYWSFHLSVIISYEKSGAKHVVKNNSFSFSLLSMLLVGQTSLPECVSLCTVWASVCRTLIHRPEQLQRCIGIIFRKLGYSRHVYHVVRGLRRLGVQCGPLVPWWRVWTLSILLRNSELILTSNKFLKKKEEIQTKLCEKESNSDDVFNHVLKTKSVMCLLVSNTRLGFL